MPGPRSQRKAPAAKKPPLTHFLCLPLVTATSKPQLEASVASFREDVSTQNPSEDGVIAIHPKAIRPVGALHCTLGVMSLNEERLNKATDLLKSLDISQLLLDAAYTPPGTTFGAQGQEAPKQPLTDQRQPTSIRRPISPPAGRGPQLPSDSITIDLKGLVSMHDAAATSIVYTEPHDPSERLYDLCIALQNIFKNENILVPDDRKLKLHATLVNTIYAKGKKSQGHGPNAKAPLKIDARSMLKRYESFVWARDVVLDRIAICEMGAKKRIENGVMVSEEYTEVASVPLSIKQDH